MDEKNFDRRLTAALQTGEEPGAELNAVLKARLYQKERELQSRPAARRLSLWWLPMTANFFVCGVPALIFALPIMPLAAHLAAFALGWLAVGGVVMTFVGLKCSDLKEQLTLELPQKGRKEMS